MSPSGTSPRRLVMTVACAVMLIVVARPLLRRPGSRVSYRDPPRKGRAQPASRS
jgi:hypothetical protein